MKSIYRIELNSTDGPVNVYLMKGSVLTLVDTGVNTELCYQQLVKQLSNRHVSISDIDQIVLTHIHEDHVGLLSKIMNETNASVYVHEKGIDSFISTGELPIEKERQADYMVSCFLRWGADKNIRVWGRFYQEEIDLSRIKFLKEGDLLFAGDQYYQVLETPGHSQLDICLYNEESKVFIGGDLLLPDITPVAYIEPPFPNKPIRSAPLIQYMNSLKKVPQSSTVAIYPGHGDIFYGADSWIMKRLLKIESKCERIQNVVKQKKSATVFEVCQEIYHKYYKKLPYTCLSDIVGHLEILETRELIRKREEKNADYYEILRTK